MMPTARRWARIRRPRSMRSKLQALAAQFIGKIQQTPPAFSAKKIHGRPAHELARKNKPVKLEPVEVEVYEFRLTGVEGSVARFAVECGAGTYIRSLAHDLGKLHGAGAHLAEITRTAVGEFTLDHAVPLAELDRGSEGGKIRRARDPARKSASGIAARHGAAHRRKARAPRREIQSAARADSAGARATAAQGAPAELDSGEWKPARLRVFNQQGQLIAIAEPVVPRTYQPVLVLEATP